MKNQLAALFMVCLTSVMAQSKCTGDQPDGSICVPGDYPMKVAQSDVVSGQAAIWVSVSLAFFLLMTMCVLCRMDPDKSADTLLYAKFIANTDKKGR